MATSATLGATAALEDGARNDGARITSGNDQHVGPGSLLAGRYEVERAIAVGGTGTLFLGSDLLLDRPIAVKVLHPQLARTRAAERFASEARLVASLAHSNLAAVYDADFAGDLPYLVMEYVEGDSLGYIISSEGPPPLQTALTWALQVARGLQYTHERGVVHRDVKPDNILVTAGGEVKIVDFGIARGPESSELTAPGWVLGTAHYLAPEIAAGEPATARSDLYALGAVLYRLFTGALPFDGDEPIAVAMAHRTEPVPPPSEVNPELPIALERIILKLLEKDPSRRYDSAGAVAADLAGVSVGLGA